VRTRAPPWHKTNICKAHNISSSTAEQREPSALALGNRLTSQRFILTLKRVYKEELFIILLYTPV
jgi:hypothetical protein